MFMQEMPVQLQGVGSSSFQSGKGEPPDDCSTADFKERSERPSGEREMVRLVLRKWKKKKQKQSGSKEKCFAISFVRTRFLSGSL